MFCLFVLFSFVLKHAASILLQFCFSSELAPSCKSCYHRNVATSYKTETSCRLTGIFAKRLFHPLTCFSRSIFELFLSTPPLFVSLHSNCYAVQPKPSSSLWSSHLHSTYLPFTASNTFLCSARPSLSSFFLIVSLHSVDRAQVRFPIILIVVAYTDLSSPTSFYFLTQFLAQRLGSMCTMCSDA